MPDVETYTIPAMTTVTITLDLAEAATLRDLLRHVGGDPDETRRGLAGKVLEALENDDVLASTPVQRDIQGGMEFMPTADGTGYTRVPRPANFTRAQRPSTFTWVNPS